MQSDDNRAISDMKEKVNINRDMLKNIAEVNNKMVDKELEKRDPQIQNFESKTSPETARKNIENVKNR
jgi:hypothetical protein